jgi:hypothetical protein
MGGDVKEKRVVNCVPFCFYAYAVPLFDHAIRRASARYSSYWLATGGGEAELMTGDEMVAEGG